ncbi:MAG TPA: MurR/RpiR family transcriptional regulator [Woeseiaceae bacterium]|nr:MurR/RpiR family transcriptional regulator [Woeseiaceae bacterium]
MRAPRDIRELREAIVARHDDLSPRLRQVAAYVLDHPNDMGLETLAVIADRCGVQASTIVRFAKAFGYEGASQMQRLFRDELISTTPSPSYAERVRQFNAKSGDGRSLTPHDLLREFTESNIIALEHLKESVPAGDLERAVDLIVKANNVYLVGLRRSFPVAAYLAYALRHIDKPAHLIDGLAGMLTEQSSMLASEDLLFAISFRPYAKETADIVQRARTAGAAVVAISDSQLSPVAREADISFDIKDAEVRQFRSLTASLCLAQTLVIAYAHRIEGRK